MSLIFTRTETMRLILVRHGESVWNHQNLFTGWYDSDLSEKGAFQAQNVGRALQDRNIFCDVVFSSFLTRAIRTAWMIMDTMNSLYIPLHCHWELNERHYGQLQGMNKKEAEKKYGQEQVHAWRRGYTSTPPAVEESDPRHPRWERRYQSVAQHCLPATESLQNTFNRAVPFFQRRIEPLLREKKTILVSAHGNSLRAVTKYLLALSDEEIPTISIPNGTPVIYEFDETLSIKNTYSIENGF